MEGVASRDGVTSEAQGRMDGVYCGEQVRVDMDNEQMDEINYVSK